MRPPEHILRSPFFYVGDKFKLINELQAYFPTDIDKFVEPFVGGGSVFMNVNANEYHLNDIDPYVIRLHKFLCRQAVSPKKFFSKAEKIILQYGLSRSFKEDIIPSELKQEYKKTYFAQFNREAYNRLRADFNETGKKDMLKLYILLIYGFNRMLRFNGKGDFNIPVGNVDFNLNVIDALNSYFEQAVKKAPIWYRLDYKKFFRKLDLGENDFVYLDPPYLITFSEYNKLWNEQHEEEMLAWLDKLNERHIRFAISNVTHYKGRINQQFITWSQKYTTHQISSNYISYHDNTIKDFNEVLITNY